MTNFWKKRKVLVTGANGFIGAWLCKALLKKEAEVIGIVREKNNLFKEHGVEGIVKEIEADITDARKVDEIFEQENPASCFHLAAKSSTRQAAQDLRQTFEVNVLGTVNVLSAAQKVSSDVIFVSSLKTYGGSTQGCFSEEHELKGNTPYAASKICCEKLCRMFAERMNLNLGIARPANIFGGHDFNEKRIVPSAIRKILKGEAPVLDSVCDNSFDFLYVEDLTEGLMLLAEKVSKVGLKGEAFNFGSGKSTSLLELVEMIAKVAGSDLKPTLRGKCINTRECLCIEKARKELCWKPRHSLKQGIEKTVECFKKGN